METTVELELELPRPVHLKQFPRGSREVVTGVLDAFTGAPLWACVGVGEVGAALGITAAVHCCIERGWQPVTEDGQPFHVAAA